MCIYRYINAAICVSVFLSTHYTSSTYRPCTTDDWW